MKYCEKCGNELPDGAEVCMNCGCATGVQKSNAVAKNTKTAMGKKKIVLIIVAAVFVAALLVGAYYLVIYIRTLRVIEDLSGRSFRYFDELSYPALEIYSYTQKELDFDTNGKLTYSYYYSSIDKGDEYEDDYQIKFEKGMIILDTGLYEYEIQYNKYGRIEGIYNFVSEELYD